MNGVDLIRVERERQKSIEGWTDEHDNRHNDGQLARAAAVYATPTEHRMHRGRVFVPDEWPWAQEWWKPSPDKWPRVKGRIRELTKAGALIAAEIDRLMRQDEEP